MKKFLSLLMTVFFVGSMFAEEAVIAPGSNAVDATVNGKDGVKAGSSQKSGEALVKVGAGATSLTFHAAAWNKAGNPVMTITAPQGVTVSPASVELTDDSGIQGSSTDFSLDGKESDYVFTVEITGAGQETELTFSCGKKKRFVVWDASYETDAAAAVAKPVITSTPEFFLDEVTVTLSCKTEGAKMYYTTDESTPAKNNGTLYEAPFKLTENTILKVIAVKGDESSAVASKTFAKADVLSVEEALDEELAGGQYVIGFITSIEEVSIVHGNATFFIADDPDSDVTMKVYRAKYLDNVEFTSEDQIGEGDKVVIFGDIKDFHGENQMGQGSYIVQHIPAGATAVENIPSSSKAFKTYRDGRLIIIKNGVSYDVLGNVIE